MSAEDLFALRLFTILPKFAIGGAFVFVHLMCLLKKMCLLVFQYMSCVLQFHAVAVSINGCLKGRQCSLLISNVVPGISGTTM